MLLIAPTEPPKLRAAGRVSSQPERHGCDVLWYAHGQRWGVQRKEVRDLIASLEDGRLTRERGQARTVDHMALIVEGRMDFTADGTLLGGKTTGGWGRDWTYESIAGQLWGLAAEGWWLWPTRDLDETIRAVRTMYAWSRKTKHQSLRTREPITTQWGRPLSREYAIYVLTSVPGVGPELAGRIYDHFGRLPVRWDVGREQMGAVAGIGPKKLDAMYRAFNAQGDGFL